MTGRDGQSGTRVIDGSVDTVSRQSWLCALVGLAFAIVAVALCRHQCAKHPGSHWCEREGDAYGLYGPPPD
jgi:hypothetical protein